MELKKTLRSGAILLELMAAILIFALAGSICVQVLVKADSTVTRAQTLRDGLSCASGAAEILRAAPSHEAGVDTLKACWPQLAGKDSLRAELEDGELEITWQQSEGIYYYNIVYYAAGEEICRIPLLRGEREAKP